MSSHTGVLAWVERTGNRLPDPVFIFAWLIGALVLISVVAALVELSALHPVLRDDAGNYVAIVAVSLLSAANIERLLTDMPTTFTHFHPLGYVLVVMLGAGVAERSGLFAAAMRAAVRNAPLSLMTPALALVSMVSNLAADAAFVILIPLAGILYAAAGRHPIAGIAASFAAVSGGFSANLVPGQLDALLFGITESAAESLDPGWDANIAGNWYFIVAMTVLYLPIVWYVTDRIIEPRLGPFTAETDAAREAAAGNQPLTSDQRRGLRRAGWAALGVVLAWVLLTFGPGTVLFDEAAAPEARLSPFFRSLVAAFFVLFLACGWAYGSATGSVSNHRDLVRMMTEAMSDLAYYLVLSFVAAHFVAMFNWSNLGLIFAVKGAAAIEAARLPMPVVIGLLVAFAGTINLFVGSASAKWALLAPVMVPMLMLVGVSPEMTTAAYRVGDSATNIITPLMVYFPLILTFCHRWQRSFGLGSLLATMIPYSVGMIIVGLAMTVAWVAFGVPLGPAAGAEYQLPG